MCPQLFSKRWFMPSGLDRAMGASTHVQHRAHPELQLGAGYDSVSGEIRASAVTGSRRVLAGEHRQGITLVSDIASLHQLLELPSSLADCLGTLAPIHPGHRLLEQIDFGHFSVCLLISSCDVRHVERLSTLQPGASASSLGGASTWTEFQLSHGDSAITELQHGACYRAAWVFHARSNSERARVIQTLHSLGLASSGPLYAGLQARLDKLQTAITVPQQVVQHGSGLRPAQLPARHELIEFAQQHSASGLNSAMTIGFRCHHYDSLPELGARYPQLTARRQWLGQPGESGVADTARRLLQLRSTLHQLDKLFRQLGHHDAELDAAREALATDLAQLRKRLRQALEHPTALPPPPPCHSLDRGVPELRHRLLRTPLSSAAAQASAADTVERCAAAPLELRIGALQLGDDPQALGLTLSESCGQAGGNVRHLGLQVKPTLPLLILEPGQQLTRIHGCLGRNHGQLSLHSSDGRRLQSPACADCSAQRSGALQSAPCRPVDWALPPQHYLLTLDSNPADDLRGLTAICVEIQPCVWSRDPGDMPAGSVVA